MSDTAGFFRLPRHNAILEALNALDGDLLMRASCWFGGGTAIVLALDEYRKSVDIDFLCADQDGYRMLRNATWGKGISGLLRAGEELQELRELRADQYGLRTAIEVSGTRIKFEIVREARIPLSGQFNQIYGVPVLDRSDMFAEKLLANMDRGNDTAFMSRDIIDLTMMIKAWGPVPEAAWDKAVSAYGDKVRDAFDREVLRIRDEDYLHRCMTAMSMDTSRSTDLLSQYGGALPRSRDFD